MAPQGEDTPELESAKSANSTAKQSAQAPKSEAADAEAKPEVKADSKEPAATPKPKPKPKPRAKKAVKRATKPKAVKAEKTETARRLRGRIEAILDWAAARSMRTGDNPARWRGVCHVLAILFLLCARYGRRPRRSIGNARAHSSACCGVPRLW